MMNSSPMPMMPKPVAPFMTPLKNAAKNMTVKIAPIANSSYEIAVPIPESRNAIVS